MGGNEVLNNMSTTEENGEHGETQTNEMGETKGANREETRGKLPRKDGEEDWEQKANLDYGEDEIVESEGTNVGDTGGKVLLRDGDEDLEEADDFDDSESSSDSDDEDLEIRKEVERLEEVVAASPYDYESQCKLISNLRKGALLDKLRAAREAMNFLYPLTPAMWSEWTQDEARLVLGTKDVLAVKALYERGIQDYLSVTLWQEYLQFVQEYDAAVKQGTEEGVSIMRKLYERALAAVGLHFSAGGQVWEAYREFEKALIIRISAAGGEGKGKQIENVKSLFLRQLTVPLANLPDVLQQYKEWAAQQGIQIGDESNELAGLPPHVCSAYKKCLQLCSVRECHEEKIERAKPGSTEQFQHYLGYIGIEEATGEPSRAQILYERAVAAFPVNQEIWLQYTHYLESNLKVAPVLKGVYGRAVRNCPWVEPLWKNYLLALERFHASDNEIAEVFEQSLRGGFQTAQEFLDLFLTRCDGLRRRIMGAEEYPNRPSDMSLLHDTFDRASQFLSTYFPDFVDQTLQLHSYWADIEAHVMKDLVAARGVWEGLIKSIGWMTEVWQAYILMELSLNNIKEARAIYRTCYSRRWEGSGTELICSAWLRFEREHGTLEDYDRAVQKVTPRLSEVQLMQFHQNLVEPPPQQGILEVKKKAKEQLGTGQTYVNPGTRDSTDGKRKRNLGFKEPKPVKRQKVDKKEEAQKETKVPSVDSVADAKGFPIVSPGPLVQDVSADAVSHSKPSRPKSPRQYTDDCTAFVSNIPYEITEDHLREFFSSVAGVKEIRLLKEKFSGRPRGFAYVDFEDEISLAAALTKDKEKLAGRLLTIARSAPKTGRGGRSNSGEGRGGRSSSGEGRGGFGHHGGGKGRMSGEDRGVEGIGGRARAGVSLGHRRGGKVSMTGTNTFAVPRSVARPLGWNPGHGADGNEVAKSNDEFKKMFLSKK